MRGAALAAACIAAGACAATHSPRSPRPAELSSGDSRHTSQSSDDGGAAPANRGPRTAGRPRAAVLGPLGAPSYYDRAADRTPPPAVPSPQLSSGSESGFSDDGLVFARPTRRRAADAQAASDDDTGEEAASDDAAAIDFTRHTLAELSTSDSASESSGDGRERDTAAAADRHTRPRGNSGPLGRAALARVIAAMAQETPPLGAVEALFAADTVALAGACASLDEETAARVALWACALPHTDVLLRVAGLPPGNPGVVLAREYARTRAVPGGTPPGLLEALLHVLRRCLPAEYARVCKTLDAAAVGAFGMAAVAAQRHASVAMLAHMRPVCVADVLALAHAAAALPPHSHVAPALARAYAAHPEWPELLDGALRAGLGAFAARLVEGVAAASESQAERAARLVAAHGARLVAALQDAGLLCCDMLYARLVAAGLACVAHAAVCALFALPGGLERVSPRTYVPLLAAAPVRVRLGALSVAARACVLFAGGHISADDLAALAGGVAAHAAIAHAHQRLGRPDVPLVLYLSLAHVARDVLPPDVHVTDELAAAVAACLAACPHTAPARAPHVLQTVHSLTPGAYIRLVGALGALPQCAADLARLQDAVLYPPRARLQPSAANH